MKKIDLLTGAILSLLSFNTYALSDCAQGEQNCWDCGKTEADLCTARLNTTTKALSITGTGEMRNYEGDWNNGNPYINTPWGMNYSSVSVQGIKNIGRKAFSYSSITNANIGDSVTSIGELAFNANYSLENFNIPDSVTNLNAGVFYNDKLPSIFIPESVTSIVSIARNGEKLGTFDTVFGQYTLYCAETTPCYASIANRIKTYTKDENGVYKIGNNYYASPDDMVANNSCGSGNSASQACIDAATVYQNQKAENMAGGALCATKQDCLELIDMSNKKEACDSIADCAYKTNCLSAGRVLYKNKCYDEYPFCKKRWTPAEANQWLNDDDNTITITFKK